MTALTALSPARTLTLFRFALAREKFTLSLWVFAISVTAIATYGAFGELYPDAASQRAFAATIHTNPAFTALVGPLWDSSVGGLTAWRLASLGGVLASLMAIFTVVRRTRADEEAGRTELLASTAVGRAAPLLAAVAGAGLATVAVAALIAIGVAAQGAAIGSAIALGCSVSFCGLFFAGVAAVSAQVFETARAATGVAGLALGISFAVRAIADGSGDSMSWLRWLSPIGWAEEIRAFGGDRLWVAGLLVLGGALLTALALWLLTRRDIGLGMVATRSGPRRGDLRTTFALAFRLQRLPALAWIVSAGVFGTVLGALIDSAKSVLQDSPEVVAALTNSGGMELITDAMLMAMSAMIALISAIAAITSAGRMVTEEHTDRAGLLLSTATSRPRWQLGHLVFVLAVPAAMLLLSGTMLGLVHGIQSGDLGGGLADALTMTACMIGPAWVIGSAAFAIAGALPGMWPVSWAVLLVSMLIAQLAPMLGLPQWVINLSPFGHIGMVTVTGVPWVALATMGLICSALIAAGMIGFRRRGVAPR